MTRPLLSLALFAGLCALSCGPVDNIDLNDAHGRIRGDVTFSGTVTVTGDIIVEEEGRLTIEPGTRIIIAADQDCEQLSHLGEHDELTQDDPAYTDAYEESHISFIVNGEISAVGTAGAPIVFTSSASRPHYTDWVGITCKKGTFKYTVVEWARDPLGTMPGHSGLTVENSLVRHGWASCINVQKPEADQASEVKGTTIGDCGHEAIDTHDPGIITISRVLITDAQAGPNLNGSVQAQIDHSIIVDTAVPVMLNTPSGSVFVTQATLSAAEQDASRWSYAGFTMPTMSPAVAVLAGPGATAAATVTNTIVFDSPYGFQNNAGASIATGWINMDTVAEPYINVAEGDGCLSVDSGFVDKAGGDYRLRGDSPLVGAGNPADGSADLGAYGGLAAGAVIGAPFTY